MKGCFVSGGIFRRDVMFPADATDAHGGVTACALVREFQEIAGDHYDALGLGRDTAVSHGCFWALARTELRFEAIVPPERELWLDSWAGRQAHGLFWRHYRLSDKAGQTLSRGVSVWLLMDIESRAMTRDRGWVTDLGGVSQPGELEATLRRPVIPEELVRRQERTVTPAEADINGHLNNASYLCWARELLSGEFAQGHRLQSVWIEYKKELPLGHSVELRYQIEGGTLFLRGRAEDKESFILRADYDSI